MKLLKKITVCLIVFLLLDITAIHSKSIYQKQINNQEIELEADMYYSSLDYYLPLTKTPVPYFDDESEINIYKRLVASPVPRYLVFELSTYPLPWMGVFTKKNLRQFYRNMDITENINIVKSVCAGFEEPYAMSVFLGNVISFKPKESKDMSGKGYMGLLVSGGNYHIKDNELIIDNWVESEIKIKGDRTTHNTKMSWSFRIGAKFHDNEYIKDVIYFSLRRDRTDYNAVKPSIFHNSNFEYTFDVDTENSKIIRHFFIVGKKIPLKTPKIMLNLSAGLVWEGEDKYTGPLQRTDKSNNFQILFRPNIEF
ncbi:MAG: hypothetical protein PHE88_03320 [Elusimicrobia bacterium]|nr:hypothetical protein [Elusimicrobiota bacterium]